MLEQMKEPHLNNLIKFLRMSGRLKAIPRSGWVEVGIPSPESVADHTFRTALSCMIFADLEDLDGLKMLQMALLHDLPEAIIGDLTPPEKTEATARRENTAMKRLLRLLPERLRERYLKLWLEYTEGKTKEARAVRELEKLEMALQAREYAKTQPSIGELKRFTESASRAIKSPEVKRLLSFLGSDL